MVETQSDEILELRSGYFVTNSIQPHSEQSTIRSIFVNFPLAALCHQKGQRQIVETPKLNAQVLEDKLEDPLAWKKGQEFA